MRDEAAGRELFNDGGEHLHLIQAALIVAGGERVALAHEAERLFAVELIDALLDKDAVLVRRERDLRLHRDAANSVDQRLKTREIDLRIIIYNNIIQIRERVDRVIDAIHAAMRELIELTAAGGVRDIIIARRIEKQDLL